MGTGSFPGVNSCRGLTLTPHPLLMPWSRKSRAIPLLPLWAVRPVQSLSACTTVHFTFTYTSIPPMGRTAYTEPQCLYKDAPLPLPLPYTLFSAVCASFQRWKEQFVKRCYLWEVTAVAQWLRYCATNRKVAGSIPSGVNGIFRWHEILPNALWPWGRLRF